MIRILAALFCVFIFSNPGEARQSPRGFLTETSAAQELPAARAKSDRRAKKLIPVFGGKPVSKVRREAGSSAISVAKRQIGTNPTGWKRLWCAVWLNQIEKKLGRPGTGSNLAKSYLSYGKRIPLSHARPGDIVVTGRKGGGHVGYFVADNGQTVTLISGNSGGRKGRRVVAQGQYAKSRVLGVVRPS